LLLVGEKTMFLSNKEPIAIPEFTKNFAATSCQKRKLFFKKYL
jgi:hypothetical protein